MSLHTIGNIFDSAGTLGSARGRNPVPGLASPSSASPSGSAGMTPNLSGRRHEQAFLVRHVHDGQPLLPVSEEVAPSRIIQIDILGAIRLRVNCSTPDEAQRLAAQTFGAVAKDRTVVVERFRTRATGGLLGYLAYHLDERCDRDYLAGSLWPEQKRVSGRNNLCLALTALRRAFTQLADPAAETALGSSSESVGKKLLQTDRGGVRLVSSGILTDVREFEELLQISGPLPVTQLSTSRAPQPAENIGADPRAILEILRQTIRLYRGPLLAGFDEEWIIGPRTHLQDRYLFALRRLIALELTVGTPAGALDAAYRGVEAEPYDEENRRQLMILLVDLGQPDVAVRQFRDYSRLMRRDDRSGASHDEAEYASGLREIYEVAVRSAAKLRKISFERCPDKRQEGQTGPLEPSEGRVANQLPFLTSSADFAIGVLPGVHSEEGGAAVPAAEAFALLAAALEPFGKPLKSDQEIAAMQKICEHLDRLPGLLRRAARQAARMSLEQIAAAAELCPFELLDADLAMPSTRPSQQFKEAEAAAKRRRSLREEMNAWWEALPNPYQEILWLLAVPNGSAFFDALSARKIVADCAGPNAEPTALPVITQLLTTLEASGALQPVSNNVEVPEVAEVARWRVYRLLTVLLQEQRRASILSQLVGKSGAKRKSSG